MYGIQKKLEQYGVNYEETMNRFVRNEDLYIKILTKLEKDENAEKLNAAIAEGDLETAFMAAHTLKGLAANLGLEPLLKAVNEIVDPLRRREQRDDYQALCSVVMDRYAEALKMVDSLKY